MSAAAVDTDPAVALRAIEQGLDALYSADWTGVSGDVLLSSLRALERVHRRLPSVEHDLIREAQARELPAEHSLRTMSSLLRRELKLTQADASARVAAAEAAGARRAVTGEQLAPRYPEVAAAQADGSVSARHARVIVRMIEQLPDEVQAELGAEIEAQLVGFARHFDPGQLATIAQRLLYCYDQDGEEPDKRLARRFRNRFVRLSQRADGSSSGSFELTAEATELLLTHFDALAKPAPEVDGVKDPRTLGQRRHDALVEALRLMVKARLLPAVKGVTATVIVTMSKKAYETGRGVARTGHGAIVPAKEALRWGKFGGDLRLLAAVLSKVKPVEAYSTAARFHNETQRLVAKAVHGGCTFPGCPVGPEGCEMHHVDDYAYGGETSVNLAAPACGSDHHERIAQGWQATVIGNRIAWLPPTWIDRSQTPQFNDLHLPGLALGIEEDEEGGDDGIDDG